MNDGIKTALEFIRANQYPTKVNIDGHEYVSIEEYDDLKSRLAESQQREELLRAVAEAAIAWDDCTGDCGDLAHELWKQIRKYKAAIEGGAMSSQWDKATEELLEERRDLWQRLAQSDSGAIPERPSDGSS